MAEAAYDRDLGPLGGPVLVCGGTYGNLEATQALLAEAKRLGIPPARIVHTGDIVAYCADPQATVDLVRESGMAVVMGNCEESLGAGASDCGCGFAEGSRCDVNAARWFEFCARRLDDDAKRWMVGLPRRVDFDLGGLRLAAVHGAPSRINRFVFASTPDAELAEEFDGLSADGIVSGHSGIPFARRIGGRLWVNAGALGMPANDGTPRVWYALLVPTGTSLKADIRPLAYDFVRAAAKMREAKLPAGYAEALQTGLWDSCEILSPTEMSQRGKSLRPSRIELPILRRAA